MLPTLLPRFRSKSLPGLGLWPAKTIHGFNVIQLIIHCIIQPSLVYHSSQCQSVIHKVSLALFVQPAGDKQTNKQTQNKPAGHSWNTDHGHGLFSHLQQDLQSLQILFVSKNTGSHRCLSLCRCLWSAKPQTELWRRSVKFQMRWCWWKVGRPTEQGWTLTLSSCAALSDPRRDGNAWNLDHWHI